MAYSIVAACVMILRYEIDDLGGDELDLNGTEDPELSTLSMLFNCSNLTEPTKFSSNLVTFLVTIYAVLSSWMSVLISQFGHKILEGDLISIILLVTPIVGMILVMTMISRQPKSSKELSFEAPFNPWFPALSIMINIHLIVELDKATWIRFAIWVLIGLVIYFGYSRRHRKIQTESQEHLNE